MKDLFETRASEQNSGRKVLSVSQLNRKAKQLLEVHLPLVWVEGEVSNVSRPSSGHWYFTLKDSSAQVRCAMFKGRNSQVKFKIEEGTQIQARAKVSLYEGRGDYQLIVEHMEEAGFGLLQKRFEQLKSQLQAEGLFEASLKKALPALPTNIGVVTSPTAAALQDVLSVLERRFPLSLVTLIPTPVQGEGADKQIIQALQRADQSNLFDTLLLCRGGGSIEDLWSFNSEELARTIAKLNTPIVSGVGHEVDFTIADFVADVRAPTPSAAAELIAPSKEDFLAQLKGIELKLVNAIDKKQNQNKNKLELLHSKLRHPGEQIQQWQQRLDTVELKLKALSEKSLFDCYSTLNEYKLRLSQHNPEKKLSLYRQSLSHISQRLETACINNVKKKESTLQKYAQALNIVSPLATLARGYAIVQDKNETIIREANKLTTGENVNLTLGKGSAKATITQVNSTD